MLSLQYTYHAPCCISHEVTGGFKESKASQSAQHLYIQSDAIANMAQQQHDTSKAATPSVPVLLCCKCYGWRWVKGKEQLVLYSG